jgi:hypothetical protein
VRLLNNPDATPMVYRKLLTGNNLTHIPTVNDNAEPGEIAVDSRAGIEIIGPQAFEKRGSVVGEDHAVFSDARAQRQPFRVWLALRSSCDEV